MCTLHPSIPIRLEAFRPRSGASMAYVLAFWTYHKSSMSRTLVKSSSCGNHNASATVGPALESGRGRLALFDKSKALTN